MSGSSEKPAATVSVTNFDSKQNGDVDVSNVNKDIPLVFFQESSYFGKHKVNSSNYIKHEEMYFALADIIDETHITGLQRVNGFWRIYIDNLTDKATLIASGVTIRGKTLPILQTNPQRLDYENTTRIRIQNIPLSVDDGTITRVLTLKGIVIISNFREKLRIQNKLTNCETGDRLFNVKTTSLKEPLERFMQFGLFKAKVIHRGQVNKALKCAKCLDVGHLIYSCKNDWKCSVCLVSGHKKGECNIYSDASLDDPSEASGADESNDEQSNVTIQGASQGKTPEDSAKSDTLPSKTPPHKQIRKMKKAKKNLQRGPILGQSNIEQFMKSGPMGNETPNKQSSGSVLRSPPTPAEVLNDISKKLCNK